MSFEYRRCRSIRVLALSSAISKYHFSVTSRAMS